MDWLALLPAAVSLFIMVDPLAAAPVFLALTRDDSPEERRRIALKAVLVGGGVLLAFGLVGARVFEAFGITIPAFRIAGGVLIFKYAFDMLHGERPGPDGTRSEIKDAIARESVGITPLGVPLLTGPGAIVTLMVFLSTADAAMQASLYFVVVLIFAVSYVVLLASARLERAVSPNVMMVTTRLMGLVLAAVAVQFVADGATDLLDAFLARRGL